MNKKDLQATREWRIHYINEIYSVTRCNNQKSLFTLSEVELAEEVVRVSVLADSLQRDTARYWADTQAEAYMGLMGSYPK